MKRFKQIFITLVVFFLINNNALGQLPIDENFIGSYEYSDKSIKIEIDIKKAIMNAANGGFEVLVGDMFYSVDGDVIFNKKGLKSDYYVYEIKHIPFLVINNMDKTVYFSVDKCKQVMVLSNVDGKKYKMSYSDEKTKSKNRSISYFNKIVSSCQLPNETILIKK